MIAAVPFAASAAVNRQMSAVRFSWLLSDRERFQTTSGRIRFLGRLPVSGIKTIPLAFTRNASRLITGQFGNSLLQPLNLSQTPLHAVFRENLSRRLSQPVA